MATDQPPASPPAPEAAPAAADAREQVRQTTQSALKDLQDRVEQEGSDFKSKASFERIQTGLQAFFEANHADAPEDIQEAWRQEVIKFMVNEIKAYNWSWGDMGIDEATKTLEAVQDPNKKSPKGQTGIGSFEPWINRPDNPHKAAYEKWKAEQKGKAEQAQTLVQKKTDVKGKLDGAKKDPALASVAQFPGVVKKFEAMAAEIEAADAVDKLATIETNIAGVAAVGSAIKNSYDKAIAVETRITACANFLPPTFSDEITKIKTGITESDGTDIQAHETSLTSLGDRLKPFEELRPLAEDAEIPPERRTQILTPLKEGKKTPEQAKAELEGAKQAANLPATADEDAPAIDKLLAWVDSMEEGKMKKALGGIALMLASICATLSKAPLIGSWFRGKAISNKLLAEKFGDEEAVLAVKVEKEFRKFGLPEDLVSDLGGKKTKEVIALIRQKPEKITTDKPKQAKLAVLAGQLEAKGGSGSDDKLVDFMSNDSVWTGIEYPGVAVAAATATPATTPGTAPAENADATAKLAKIFEGLTADEKSALEGAKAKEVAAETFPSTPASLRDNDRTKKISAKLKENGAAEATVDPNQTVLAFIQANLAKNWEIA